MIEPDEMKDEDEAETPGARAVSTAEEREDSEESEDSEFEDSEDEDEDPEDEDEDGDSEDEDEDSEVDDSDEEDDDSDEEDDDSDEEDDDSDEEDDEDEDEDEDPVEDGIIRVRYYGITDVGLIREHNEDNLVMVDLEAEVRDLEDDQPRETVLGERGIVLAVCDGMGGAAAGEVASQMAVDTVHEVVQAARPTGDRDYFAHRLVYSIEEAGGRIFGAAKMDRTRRGMGTTSTVAGLIDKVLFVGQVGDSRCYVLRNGKLSLITKDQSLVNQLIEAGQLTEEEAEAFEHSNIILQALGTTEEVTVDLTFLELRRGDRIMLCSDGLSGLVHAEMIEEVLAGEQDLVAVAKRLVEMANAGGGHDNITCIVADFEGDGLAAPDDVKPGYVQYPLPPLDHSPELPQREPTLKTGVRKPGADVKRPVVADPDVSLPHQGGRWWPLLLLLIIAAVVAAIVFGMDSENGQTEGPDAPTSTVVEAPLIEPRVEVAEPVDVVVTTDISGAELFVDGRRHGPLEEGQPVHVELPPGAYRFEARVAGSSVATATTTVREGTPADVALMLPEGTVGVDPDDIEEMETTTQQLVAPTGMSAPSEMAPSPMETVTETTPTEMVVRPAMRETSMTAVTMEPPPNPF